MALVQHLIKCIPIQKSVNVCLKHSHGLRLNRSFSAYFYKCVGERFPSQYISSSGIKSMVRFNSKSIHMLSKCYKDREDLEEKSSKDTDNLLERDSELQNILNDIMNDFSDSNPPTKPPKTKHIELNEKTSDESQNISSKNSSKEFPISTDGKFEVFDESQTEVIYDFDEEVQGQFYLYQEKDRAAVQKYNLKRGQEGVFDVTELVSVLKQENATDIAVLLIPKHLSYCDYMVIATARSPKHLKVVSEFINILYKQKKAEKDKFIVPEGKKSKDWKVLDMGNIVLHIFLEETRHRYDLETLWTVDGQFDSLLNPEVDPVLGLMEQHILFLDEIQTLPISEKQ